MKKALILLAGIGILSAGPAAAYNGKLLNGKAVSVHYRFGGFGFCESSANPWRGSIVVYTLQNSKVTRADTVYKKELGYAHYAAFNLAGTKIAFYRFGQAPSAGGGCVSANGGKSCISMINPDGTGLTDLCELPALPAGTEIFPLDWPAGDWIYYTRPHDAAHSYNGNNGSTVIWRVNSVTKANESVCNFTDNGSGIEEKCNSIRRFTLSDDGKFMGLMYVAGGKGGCTADVINNHENNIHPFPPANCAIVGTSIAGAAGCNISISPSGKIMGSYFAGAHDQLMLDIIGSGPGASIPRGVWIDAPLYNPGCAQCIMEGLAGSLTKWTGEFVGRGAELIRWSANSDKWVMQKIGNGQDGHAGDNDQGSNQVVCNWVDSVAINISKNPPPPIPYPAGYVFQNNDAGDLWVSDPGNNPSADRYEDMQGRWHTAVDNAVVGSHIAVSPPQIYAAVEKDSALANKTLQVTNIGVGTLNAIAAQVTYGPGATDWLAVTTSGAGNSQQIALQFKNTSFAANTYHATLVVYAPGTPDSAYVPVDLSIQITRNPDNPTGALAGLAYKYYTGTWFPPPDFSKLTPASTGVSTNFSLSPSGSNHSNYGFTLDGYIDAPAQGMYAFTVNADDAARFSIGSTLVATSDWLHTRSGSIALKAGKHAVHLDFSQTGGGDGLSVSWECQKAGITSQPIPANRLFRGSASTLAAFRVTQLSTPSATRILYNLQGKRVGILINGMKGGLPRITGRELLLASPEKTGDRASGTILIVR
jgi:hypothetical protein